MERNINRIANIAGHLLPNNTHSSGKSSVCPVTGMDFAKVHPRLLEGTPIRICITGAAGNTAYPLLFMIASGQLFGPRQQITLHLLETERRIEALKAVEMELIDCAFPLLNDLHITTSLKEAFLNVDIAILIGAAPRDIGIERKDLIPKNATIFQEQGRAINEYASRNVKVVVVGNPANTNALITIANAPHIPRENFSSLNRLDQNRAIAQVSSKTNVPISQLKNVVVWGNHSPTQFPDLSFSYMIDHKTNKKVPISDTINDQIRAEMIQTVQQRGLEVIRARKLSSSASAAKAIVDHVKDWFYGTKDGEYVSMGVYSNGSSYGVPSDIVFSFPVTIKKGHWHIVPDLELDDFSREMIEKSAQELIEERSLASAFFASKRKSLTEETLSQ